MFSQSGFIPATIVSTVFPDALIYARMATLLYSMPSFPAEKSRSRIVKDIPYITVQGLRFTPTMQSCTKGVW